ncbi:MAG: hypothetical protein GX575_04335 [Candidatus Anammoximicrobium sp.]|nr:hypothetical protein [Candidatus Anammoximicrobium sp.]
MSSAAVRVFSFLCLLCVLPCAAAQSPTPAGPPANWFGNAGFEDGRETWRMDCGGQTAAEYTVDAKDAAAGQRSALIRVATVAEWGVQFGQTFEAGSPGQTYTFAVLARSNQGPVTIRLAVERRAEPWDRPGASPPLTITDEGWKEYHLTFRVDKSYPEGWFAYVSCSQARAEFRLDAMRFYEGEYIPCERAEQQQAAAAAVHLFDTAVASPAPLTGPALAQRSGWFPLPEDETDHAFRGDAVLLNDRLAVRLRRGAGGAEVYSPGAEGWMLRAVLAPGGEAPGAALTSVTIVDNTPSEVSLDAAFASPGGKPCSLRFSLAMGQMFVKTEPQANVTGLSVAAPCRFAVLPDFFADDIVIDAAELPVAAAELPSENFLLHLLPGRDAVVMTVASRRDRDARITLSGEGDQRRIDRSVMDYGPKGTIWVAVLGGREVWHQREVRSDQAGQIIPLDWTAPFPAQWRVDWRLADRLTASWELVSEQASGEFIKYGWFGNPETLPATRLRWTTVYGRFPYPCWFDREGRAFFQPLKKTVCFDGPAVIYPINRIRHTPLDQFTVVDVVRATLGVGPCEYILDVEGQGATRKGRATCATRDALKAIYGARQQKQRRAEIETILDEVVQFVTHIRSRIDQYVDFGHELLAYLDQQKLAHPELAEFLADMASATKAIDAAFEKRQASIRSPQYVIDLTDEFRKTLLDNEEDDALPRCTKICEAIVVVGGNQDELVGECRNAVKILRQRAGLAMAQQPQTASIAKEIRDRTQKVLRQAASYEAPRH